MATSRIARPRIRVFGILVEGANVRHSAHPRPFDRACHTCRPLSARSLGVFPVRYSLRSFASSTVKARPGHTMSPSLPTADQLLAEELQKANNVLASDISLGEKAAQGALQICEDLARSLVESIESPTTRPTPGNGPTSNLLSLEDGMERVERPSPPQSRQVAVIRGDIADKISATADRIVTNPKVFITPALLATYVYTQSLLGRPESFPLVFDLYASKPTPQPGTSPIKYKIPNPDRASSAVPLVLAHTALDVAIKAKDLPLCLSIINTSVCTTAHMRNKVLRKALLPLSGLALAPAAAYVLASNLAQYQYSMDTQMATNMAFVGIMAYVTFTSIIGVVAITTANDQMDRITWAMGTPLRDRWLREDERALVDRVAGAWGFQNIEMRGEEEAPEWEALREWAGMRGLILDKPELMEGME